jgi:hypothetical protein
MKLEQLKVLVKASNKIFIWSNLSSQHGAYFHVTKSAVSDYLNTLSSQDDFSVEIDELGDLYLGCTDPDD